MPLEQQDHLSVRSQSKGLRGSFRPCRQVLEQEEDRLSVDGSPGEQLVVLV